MKSTIPIVDPKTEEEYQVEFYYDLEKGRPATRDNPAYPDIIIDLWHRQDLYSERFNKVIDSEREYVERMIWKELGER